jgi:hypothetical protein
MTDPTAALARAEQITRKVRVSEEIFQQLGASGVQWGEPDPEGFYSPTVYRRDDVLLVTREGLAAALKAEGFVRGMAHVYGKFNDAYWDQSADAIMEQLREKP